MSNTYDLIVLGGGAAGYFSAIAAAESNCLRKIAIVERNRQILTKVRISGGGRCNVTHYLQDQNLLSHCYPRGKKELIAPFHLFGPLEMIQWLESKGVELKVEEDGRMFPISDNSQTIINCLVESAKKTGVELLTEKRIEKIIKEEDFMLQMENGGLLKAKKLILATGSSPKGHEYARDLGHTIIDPVPSLFTFKIPQFFLAGLAGVSTHATVKIETFEYEGPILITHWGFSGPAVLKLSAFAARYLHERNYKEKVIIEWVKEKNAYECLLKAKSLNGYVGNTPLFSLPRQLWKILLEKGGIDSKKSWKDIGNKQLAIFSALLLSDAYLMDGRITHKEEFVTCGGVDCKEVDFKTMQSKKTKGLFFAGEILNIDGITGGFNFQNAWTTGWIAGQSI